MDDKKLIGDAGRTEYLREIVEELKNDPDWQLPPPARFWLYSPWEWDLIYQ